jgi:hypothetical protein
VGATEHTSRSYVLVREGKNNPVLIQKISLLQYKIKYSVVNAKQEQQKLRFPMRLKILKQRPDKEKPVQGAVKLTTRCNI